MAKEKKIALAFPLGTPHHDALINGVIRYVKDRRCSWSFLTSAESTVLSILDLRGWSGDGIITKLNLPREAAYAAKLDIPVVNVSATLSESPVPRVTVDNRQVGRIAAEHLMERGFRRFAYCGIHRAAYSALREEGFRTRLNDAGFDCDALRCPATFRPRGKRWADQQKEIEDWMSGLERPFALFVVADYRARLVLDLCHKRGLRVPEDLSIISVDNEKTICEHSDPRLTSIDRNARLVGYRAAEMLDQMIRGGDPTEREATVPPKGIVVRDSTDTLAVEDSRLRNAVLYIQAHLRGTLRINDVLAHTSVSRRWLEYAFREHLGESPHQYITRQRVELAKRLIEERPELKFHEVAAQAGFSRRKQLSLAFQRLEGVSLREYRRSLKMPGQPVAAAD